MGGATSSLLAPFWEAFENRPEDGQFLFLLDMNQTLPSLLMLMQTKVLTDFMLNKDHLPEIRLIFNRKTADPDHSGMS